MATPRARSQLAIVDTGGGSRSKTVADAAFMAEIISARALRHFVRAHSGGDRALAWVAGRQLGVIATWQLRTIGLGSSAVSRRVRRGSLHRLYRGVFLVGHSIPLPGARELAAVLVCGEGTLVSHRSAALLWGLAGAGGDAVEVSAAGRHCRPRPGLLVHRPVDLLPADRSAIRGIPVTSPARTMIDFAAGATADELEQALAQARVQRLLSNSALAGALARGRNRAGARALRAALRREGGPRLTRSEAEGRLLRMVRAADLPEPQTNALVAGFEVDFLWSAERVIVEVDGFAFHGHRTAFERDHRRDMVLRDAGYEVIRVTWRQLVEEPLRVIAHITRALTRARHSSSASSP